jgi:hypothetical protein
MPIDIGGTSIDSIGARLLKNNSIVTSGLILHLDAAQSASYPGSGTTWTDLSGVMGNVNVQNRTSDWSFAVEPSTKTYCLYNATNRTTSAGINISMTNFSKSVGAIEIWVKPTGDHTGGHGYFVNSDGADYTNASNWFWWGTWDTSNIVYLRQGNPSTCCNDLTVSSWSSTYYPLNTWVQLAITWNVSGGRTAIYRNGVLLNSRSDMPTNIPNTNPTATGQLFNSHTRGDNMQFKGYCSIYRIYNSELSAAQIYQNFTANQSRFGL